MFFFYIGNDYIHSQFRRHMTIIEKFAFRYKIKKYQTAEPPILYWKLNNSASSLPILSML